MLAVFYTYSLAKCKYPLHWQHILLRILKLNDDDFFSTYSYTRQEFFSNPNRCLLKVLCTSNLGAVESDATPKWVWKKIENCLDSGATFTVGLLKPNLQKS